MGVPHNPFRTKEQEGEEFYGPIDGVKPEHHRENYGLLPNLKCITPLERPLYYDPQIKITICQPCHTSRFTDEERQYFIPHGSHNLQIDTHARPSCAVCRRRVVLIREAERCRECIEEYLETDDPGKAALARGDEIEVITRW